MSSSRRRTRERTPLWHPSVQSRTVLDNFAEQMEDRLGPHGAVATVAVCGRLAAYAHDDDWRYTLRAQYARIDGPLLLSAAHGTNARRCRCTTASRWERYVLEMPSS